MAESNKDKSREGKSGSFVKELLSGIMVSEKIILRNFWYIILLTVLGAIYIGNRFHAEKITRETNQTFKRGKRSES